MGNLRHEEINRTNITKAEPGI